MPFTFECGTCHAVYRLDENQITVGGVKITCPRCLNYFFFKRGSSETIESAVVEYVVQDGAYDVSTRPLPSEVKSADKPTQTPIPAKSSTPRSSSDEVVPNLKAFTPSSDTQTTAITAADLSDLPPDPPPTTAFDQYIILGSLIIISAATILFLNFAGYVSIPGMEKLRKTQPVPQTVVTPSNQKTPKYGFPEVDSEFDPWTGKAKPTPVPVPQAQEAE